MKISRLEKNGQRLPTATFVTRNDFMSDSPIKLREEFLQELTPIEIKSSLEQNDSEDYFENNYEDQIQHNSDLQAILYINEEYPNYDIERIYKKIYLKYKSAMERKKGREALNFEGFFRHYFEEHLYRDNQKIFGNDAKGYLLGVEEGGIFIPMHFAPAGLRLGASLINDLNENRIPTCFFIPEDLRDTIIKLPGWKTVNYQIPMNFRGKTVIKYPVFNNIKAVIGIIQKQLQSIKAKYIITEEFKNFVEKISRIFKKQSIEFQDEILEDILKEMEAKRSY